MACREKRETQDPGGHVGFPDLLASPGYLEQRGSPACLGVSACQALQDVPLLAPRASTGLLGLLALLENPAWVCPDQRAIVACQVPLALWDPKEKATLGQRANQACQGLRESWDQKAWGCLVPRVTLAPGGYQALQDSQVKDFLGQRAPLDARDLLAHQGLKGRASRDPRESKDFKGWWDPEDLQEKASQGPRVTVGCQERGAERETEAIRATRGRVETRVELGQRARRDSRGKMLLN